MTSLPSKFGLHLWMPPYQIALMWLSMGVREKLLFQRLRKNIELTVVEFHGGSGKVL